MEHPGCILALAQLNRGRRQLQRLEQWTNPPGAEEGGRGSRAGLYRWRGCPLGRATDFSSCE